MCRSRYPASHDRTDDRRPALVEPEDENSWFIHAVGNDGDIAGSYRVTRGSDGFSLRQIARYELEPFVASSGLPFERVHQRSSTNRSEHDDLVQVIAFPHGPGALIGLGHGPGLPACIEQVVRTAGARSSG